MCVKQLLWPQQRVGEQMTGTWKTLTLFLENV